MTLILKRGNVEIWQVENDYVVYLGTKLVRTCPSIGMAREVASGL